MHTHTRPIPARLALLAGCILSASLAAQWHDAQPALAPSPRSLAGMTYDLLNTRSVLFGGVHTTAPFANLGDTWTFGGTTWTPQSPAHSPSARPGIQLVHDLPRGVVVLYGGTTSSLIGGPSQSDTWEWNGTDWTQIVTPQNAGARGRYGAAFDLARGRTVIYGGVANTQLLGALSGTWEYDGTTWTQRTTAHSPGALQDPAMCFDLVHQRVVLFGGSNPFSGANNATWVYDGVDWTQVATTGTRPSARAQARMFFDGVRCVLFGGGDNLGNMLGDTWSFDGTSWKQEGGLAPTARLGHAVAFDPQIGDGVLFGGIDNAGPSAATWLYDGASIVPFGNGCVGSAGVPQLGANIGARVGGTLTLTLTNLVPAVPVAAFVIGFSDSSYLGVPLPADLAVVGMPACPLLVSIDQIDVAGAAGGSSLHAIAVPANPLLVSLPFFAQGVSLDPGLNAFGGAVSNGLRGRIGS